jgi:hypothetical protein
MNQKEIFITGCKLLSIYCFVTGVPLIFTAVATFFSKIDVPSELQTSFFITSLGIRITPILLIAVGIYLLKQSDKLYHLVFKKEEAESTSFEKWLKISIKVCGLFLIIQYLPNLVQSISTFWAMETAPPIFEMFQENEFTSQYAFSSIFAILLGVYLLVDGRIFTKMGIKNA